MTYMSFITYMTYMSFINYMTYMTCMVPPQCHVPAHPSEQLYNGLLLYTTLPPPCRAPAHPSEQLYNGLLLYTTLIRQILCTLVSQV